MNDILISINLPTFLLLIITLLAIGACFFLIGHYYGSRNYIGVNNNIRIKQKQADNIGPELNISINDKKIVTKINTDNLEKKYSNLGDKTETLDNISESVNRLKNIKR